MKSLLTLNSALILALEQRINSRSRAENQGLTQDHDEPWPHTSVSIQVHLYPQLKREFLDF